MEHVDIVGNKLKPNMVVLFPHKRRLLIGTLTQVESKLKTVLINGTHRRYAADVIHVDHPKITMRLLTNDYRK